MDSNPPVLAPRPPLPSEIRAVRAQVVHIQGLVGSLLNIVSGSATTPGITPQEFKEHMKTEYVQKLITLVDQELVRVRAAIDAIPDAPPA